MEERAKLAGARFQLDSLPELDGDLCGTAFDHWIRTMKKPRVLLADDHQIVLDGLLRLLEKEFLIAGASRRLSVSGASRGAPARCHCGRHLHAAIERH